MFTRKIRTFNVDEIDGRKKQKQIQQTQTNVLKVDNFLLADFIIVNSCPIVLQLDGCPLIAEF